MAELIYKIRQVDQYVLANFRLPDWLSAIVKLFSLTPKIWYPILVILNWSLFNNNYLLPIILLFVGDIFIFLMKRVLGRARPTDEKPTIMKLITGFGPDGYSFPSAHTFTVFQLVPLFFELFGILALVYVVYACLVGISRLVHKHHFLSDVLASVVLGFIYGYLIVILTV